MCSLQDENRLLQNSNELMRRHCEEETVAGRSLGNLVKCVRSRFVSMVVCINRAIPNCYLRDISELNYFS